MLSTPSVVEPDSSPKSTEEKDHLERSTKKIKSDHSLSSHSGDSCFMESENIINNLDEASEDSTMNDLDKEPMTALTTGVKLNTDGCVYESKGKAGFGGLFRDHEGKWLLGYYGKLNVVTSLEAELWGIYRGLTIMFEKGYNNILVESDSLDAVTLINGDSTTIHPNSTLIGDARMLLMRTQSLLTHIFREANSSADHLAHLGAEQSEDLMVTEESPQSDRIFVREDWLGRSHARE